MLRDAFRFVAKIVVVECVKHGEGPQKEPWVDVGGHLLLSHGRCSSVSLSISIKQIWRKVLYQIF